MKYESDSRGCIATSILTGCKECPHGIMVKALDWGIVVRVRTLVKLLGLISDKYIWERHELPYPPIYGLNNTITVFLKEGFDIK